MTSFEGLPTELRHMILEDVVLPPPSPPLANPDEIGLQGWVISPSMVTGESSEQMNGHIGRTNGLIFIAVHTSWVGPHQALLLVSRSFKADVVCLLRVFGEKVTPLVDIMVDRCLWVSWLRVPHARLMDRLDIQIRCFQRDCQVVHHRNC